MTGKTKRQYGLWDSPISPISLARGISFSDIAWDESGALIWREGRSDRGVLVVRPPDGQALRDLNSDYSIRARVGYGGGDFSVKRGMVFFAEADSGRLYRQPLESGSAHPITPAFGNAASPTPSPDGRWVVFVHTYEEQDHLAIVDAEGQMWPDKLVSGEDFYMQPTWSPDSSRLAWVAWNHPNMPWDGTFLRTARVVLEKAGLPGLDKIEQLAGGEEISVFQPSFSPDGRWLAYISDESGWWQLYLYDLNKGEHRQMTHEQAEHGAPAWMQGIRTYTFSADGKDIFFIRNKQGFNSLWKIDAATGTEKLLGLDEQYTALDQIDLSGTNGQLALIASGLSVPTRVITYQTEAETRVIQRSTAEDLSWETYSIGEAIEWLGLDGLTAYGIFYPPHNPAFEGHGKPPLIIHIHGGPTSQVKAAFNPRAQFFTSRGYAFLEVNYRGSTGYGRAYRNMLRGCWGSFDVEDAVSGARTLVEKGRVDGSRLVIMGGSAGGFTVLKALEDYPNFFKAGICLYGVSNQFNLAAETHKFEARYTDTLLGPLPEAADLYRECSPIFFADKIKDPIAIFQGEIDTVVPRSQSDTVVDSLQRRGVPHEYHLYPGEGHGFRKTETIEAYYKSVDKFLKQHVIFA
jgi:dipeptidyl aminopeptidase/acylaminoacyl peptidase